MIGFVIRRCGAALLVMFAVSVLTFLIFQTIPNGDPALRMAGRSASPEVVEAVRHQYGFDRSLPVQYALTMKAIFTGNVESYTQQTNVMDQMVSALPPTISLAIGAGVCWLVFGVLLGLIAATRAGRFLDRLITMMALTGVSLPIFFVAATLLYFFAYKIPIFPNGGYVPLAQDPGDWFMHMLLPWFSLSILAVGIYSRLLRSEMLERMNDDFVRTAKAKGIGKQRVLYRHVLRNSIMPIFSLWSLDFAATIGGGAILIESVFSLHGLGQFAATSIAGLDVPPLLVIVMFASFFVVIAGVVSDIINMLLDPRIKVKST
ncbi:MAG: ABC transporter permease [Nocardioidaceae bacterium]|nr:MAG: ABC transporter permease [Nocardioidaceae bacterium]